MTKQITPLRRKDQATGYQAAVRDIVAWLRKTANMNPQLPGEKALILLLCNAVEAEFGKANVAD